MFSGSGFNSKHFQSPFDQHETTTTGGSITTAVLVGLPTYMYLFRLLRSVMNAAARLRPRHSDHISDALVSLHWLRAQETVRFKFDGRAHVEGHSWNCAIIPESTGLCRRSAWSGQRFLRSAQTNRLLVQSTVGGRAFPVAGHTGPDLSVWKPWAGSLLEARF